MGKINKPFRKVNQAAKTLVILSLCALLTVQEETIELKLGELSRYYKLQSKELKYFKLNLSPDQFDGSQDLIIKVQSPDQQGDPDAYISKTNSKPSTYDNSQWVCSTYGRDTCSISHKNISRNDNFYIGVRCFQECRFRILSNLAKEIDLEDSVEMQLDFAPFESKIFRFYIPSAQTSKDEENKVNSVIITAAPFLPTSETILLSASTKPDVIPTSGSRKGVPGWRKGLTLRLSEQNKDEWCTDCWVTILVDVQDSGKYYVTAKTNVGIMQLHQLKKVDDVAFFGDRTCYKYYVQQEDHDVYIRAVQYSGLISYSFNPQSIPKDFESAAFKNADQHNSILIASAHDRSVNATKRGLYYLCVYPHMTSTYSLMIQEVSTELPFKYLEDGYDENGEVLGSSIAVYIYKVPPLKNLDVDIKLEFFLATISGTIPQLGAYSCKEYKDHKKCAQDITNETVFGSDRMFQLAKQAGNNQKLIIDHDERECQDKYSGECYYTVVVVGQGPETEYSTYSIQINQDQQNHFVLQEGKLVTDFVERGTTRWYSFTLVDDHNVKNVTFRLNTLHGDADIYVSRTSPNPNKLNYEKSSFKTNEIVDQVSFDGANLTATYYLGVYSYQYSTYNLIAEVDRGQQTFENIPLLVEGVQVRGSIHNEVNQDFYRIQVKQVEGYEKSIKIQTSPLEGKVKLYVSPNAKASKQSYTWMSTDNMIVINPKDKNFQRDGTYFVTVAPNFNVWQYFYDNYYTYMISYSTADQYQYLQSKTAFDNKQEKGTTSYFRHFITDMDKDVSLSMTVFSGDPQLYVALDPSKKWPNNTNFDYHVKNQSSIQASKGKALYFSQYAIKKWENCKNSAVTEEEPCTIFASVFCQEDCKYSLKVTYENNAPQQVIVGVPQHSIVKDGTNIYYYLNVRQNKTKQLYSDLTSLSGNADLYVKFIDNPQDLYPEQWAMPNKYDYDMSSIQAKGKDVIKIKPSDLQDCFNRFNVSRYGYDKECVIVFGIYAPESQLIPSHPSEETANVMDVDKYNTRFNFVVYTDIMQLMSQTPVSGYVDQGEFQYFLYEATNDDCTILVSLSTELSGDPDLYINFGDTSLPTTSNYDIQSSTFKSELTNINLDNSYFKNKGIKSMKGPYIIGVYGVKKSNFTLSVSQEKYPIHLLQENQPLMATQEPFEVTYFLWYDFYQEKDFKISLNVKRGVADIYLGTFDEADESQSLVERMPKTKQDTFWMLENIASTSGISNKELLVVNQEKNYCFNCYYIIGVFTSDQQTEYTLSVQVLDANYNNSQFMRIGETYQNTLKLDQFRLHKFLIEDRSTFSIMQKSSSGNVESYLSYSGNSDDVIFEIKGTQTITIYADDPRFETDKMYYIYTKGLEEDNEYSLTVQQQYQIIQLSDGVSTALKYHDARDVSKYLTFSIPEGDVTLSIQVKTSTPKFFPRLYYKLEEDLFSEIRQIDFPPEGPTYEYFICNNWDRQFQVMNCQKQFKGLKGGKSGLVLNLVENSQHRKVIPVGEVSITLSASSLIQLPVNSVQMGSLMHSESFVIYQVDEGLLKKKGYLAIEFSQCLGESEYIFLDNPKLMNKKADVKILSSYKQYGQEYAYIALPRDHLFIMARPKPLKKQSEYVEDDNSDFLIKVKYSSQIGTQNTDYHLANEGKVTYTLLGSGDDVQLQWGKISNLENETINQGLANTSYHIVYTKDQRARLDSVCAMRTDVINKYKATIAMSYSNNYTLKRLDYSNQYQMNVLAKINLDGEIDYIPYQQTEVTVPSQRHPISKFLVLILLVCVGVFSFVTFHYWRKVKKNDQEPEFEMTSVSKKIPSPAGSYEQPKLPDKEMGYSSVETIDGVDDSMRHALGDL